ncbi:hypothetical protein [Fontibacillus sp. BL9]|uniref:hypothetical protein n=1 Tax=Fontibacillus sp. BL9 TaxID=3389971 RepID=UPI00397C2CB1
MISSRSDRGSGVILLLAVILFLGIGVFYFFWYRPAVTESRALFAEQEETLNFLQQTEAIAEEKRKDTEAADNQKFEQAKVPSLPDREQILRDVETAAKTSGMTVNEVAFLSTNELSQDIQGTGEEAGTADAGKNLLSELNTTKLETEGLASVSLEVRLSGTLPQMKSFAANLQKEERLYISTSLLFGDESNNSTTVAAVMGLTALYRPVKIE